MAHSSEIKRQFKLHPELSDQFQSKSFIPFVLMHLGLIGLFWTGLSWTAIGLCIGLYITRVFSITAGYHRYFSHRSFKTSRVFQFILAFMGTSAWQKGPLWWAAKHREHHRDSDTDKDAHSPRQFGLFDAHMGWIHRKARATPDMDLIKDFSKFPELQWLEKHYIIPGLIVAIFCFSVGGLSGLIGGFLLSTVLVYHATFTINSINHMIGKQRYLTGDDSRNNGLLALITMGEGWHNNHHYYPSSSRNGFFWWEIDMTYYILVGLEKVKLVWNLRHPPQSILNNEKAPTQKIIDKCAYYIVEDFSADFIAKKIINKWKNSNTRENITENITWDNIKNNHYIKNNILNKGEYFDTIVLPELPSFKTLEQKAIKKFNIRKTALQESIEQAKQMLENAVIEKLAYYTDYKANSIC